MTTNHYDSERLDLESASSAYRRRKCTGSANLVRALREAGKLVQRLSLDAASGSRVHRAWCGEKVSELTRREADTLESLRRMEAMLVTDWAGGSEYVLMGREVRLWLHEGLDPIHSGAFDVAYASGYRMLIIDGKTLFSEVSPAVENDQLRELVALARANFARASEFTVAILQPWVSQRPSVALYDATEAELALRELKRTLGDNADVDAPRTAGAWCEYCPAFELCDTSKALSIHTTDLAQAIEQGSFALPVGVQGARLLEAVKLGAKYLEAVTERYKAMLAESPDAVPGWQLKPGRKVREITDKVLALAISPEFMTLDEFESTLSVNVTLLEQLVGKGSGLQGRALSDLFNQRFAEVIQYKQQGPILAKRKELTR